MSPDRIDTIARLVIVDILLEAQEAYWLRRAMDFAGVGTPACDEIARACRAKATLCRGEGAHEWSQLLAVELGDVG